MTIKYTILAFLLALSCGVQGQSCCDKLGIKEVPGMPSFYYPGNGGGFKDSYTVMSTTTTTLDAAGEMLGFMGRLHINGEPTTAKNCTAAGGCSISWRAGTISGFAGSDDTIQIGIQDLSTSAVPSQPDETFGVSGTFAGDVDPPTTGAWNTSDMETDGDDTSYSNGDMLAVVWNLSACNGCSVRVQALLNNTAISLPTSALKTAGTWAQQGATVPNVLITFDDGSLGWIDGGTILSATNITTYNSGSTPDEYALMFTVPFNMKVDALYCMCANGSAGDGELILYSGADTSSPVALATVVLDDDQTNAHTNAAKWRMEFMATPVYLRPGATYAVAYRPTSANNVTLQTMTLADASHRAAWTGTNMSLGTRSDQTGAFSSTTTTIPVIGVRVSGAFTQ